MRALVLDTLPLLGLAVAGSEHRKKKKVCLLFHFSAMNFRLTKTRRLNRRFVDGFSTQSAAFIWQVLFPVERRTARDIGSDQKPAGSPAAPAQVLRRYCETRVRNEHRASRTP